VRLIVAGDDNDDEMMDRRVGRLPCLRRADWRAFGFGGAAGAGSSLSAQADFVDRFGADADKSVGSV
jgi:hypothetical protein